MVPGHQRHTEGNSRLWHESKPNPAAFDLG
jgi:hypothetical protein